MSEDIPFMFVGDALALDLINTVKIVRGQIIDTLQTPDDLAQWWSLAHEHHPQIEVVSGDIKPFDENTLATIKSVRDHLHDLFLSVIEGQQPDADDLPALNWALGSGHPTLVWQEGGRIEYSSTEPAAKILLPAALSALRLLTQADLSRLHKCQSNQCILLFYDTTKSGTRHWCSTACMDRDRSRRRYSASKQG
ncbi:MAG: ABATE domain-containing protein [Anaerolineae bacterium]|nr:ABATE domain-containing protein [Anaerolineae bacterium]